MSKTIDERIVKMTLEAKEFVQSVDSTIKSIEKLKSSTDSLGTSNGIVSFEKAANKLNLSGLYETIDNTKNSFGALEIAAVTAIANIANKATNAGIALAKSLSVDQISQGWTKYASAIQSQQTIMSAISDKRDENGNLLYDLDAVIERIDKLKWYSDETSYSVTQMTDAIGSFTSSGVDLDIATQAVIGISNACADAGVSTEKAQSAFIGLSKAIGQGYLSNGVWVQQIKTSGLANSEKFKQSIIDAAVAIGTLNEELDENGNIVYKTSNKTKKAGEEVSIADFTSALSQQWATTEVLNRALFSYSDTVDSIYGLVTNGKIDTSSKVIADLTEEIAKQGKTLSDFGLDETYDTASEAIETLVNAYKKLGMEVPQSLLAFTHAQEAISFEQAIQSIKDAVSSKWSTTFELVFGNYEEAKKLWTKLSEEGWKWFAAGGEKRNELLAKWHDASPLLSELDDKYNKLKADAQKSIGAAKEFDKVGNEIDKLKELYSILEEGNTEEIAKYWDLEKKHFKDVLPEQYEYINNLREEYISQEGLNKFKADYHEEMANYLKDTVEIRSGYQIFVDAFNKMLTNITTIVENIREAWSNIFPDTTVDQLINITKGFENFIKLLTPSESFLERLKNILEGVFSVLDFIRGAVEKIYTDFITPIANKLAPILNDVFSIFSNIGKAIRGTNEDVQDSGFPVLTDILNTLYTILEPFIGIIADIVSWIKKMTDSWDETGEKAEKTAEKTSLLATILESIRKAFQKLGELKIGEGITKAFEFLANLISKIVDGVEFLIGYIKELFGSLQENSEVSAMTIGAGAFIFLKILDIKWWKEKLEIVRDIFTQFTDVFAETIQDIQWKMETDAWENYAKVFLSVGAALLLIALALKTIANIDEAALGKAVTVIAGLISGLVILFEVLNKSSSRITKGLSTFDKIGQSISNLFERKFKMNRAQSVAKSVAYISGAILILVGAIWVISKIEPERLWASVAVVAGFLAAMIGIIAILFKLINTSKKGKLNAESVGVIAAMSALMLTLGAAMIGIAAALAIVSLLDTNKMIAGAIAIGAVLAAVFALIIWLNGNVHVYKNHNKTAEMILSLGASMLLIGAAMVEIASALAILSLLDTKKLIDSSIVMGAILAIIAVILGALSSIKGGSLAFLAIGGALILIATGMVIMSGALIALAGAIKLFNTIKWGSMLNNLAKMLVLMLGLDIIAIVAIPAVLGFTLLAAALTLFSGALSLIMTVMKSAIDVIAVFILVGDQFGEAFFAILSGIVAAVIEVFPSLMVGIAEGIVNSISKIIEVIQKAIDDVVVPLATLMFESFIKTMDVLNGYITPMTTKLIEFIAGIINGVSAGLPDFVSSIVGLLVSIIEGVAKAIDEHSEELGASLRHLMDSSVTGITEFIKGFLGSEEFQKQMESLWESIPLLIRFILNPLGTTIEPLRNMFQEARVEVPITLVKDEAEIERIKNEMILVGEDIEKGYRAYFNEADQQTYYIPIEKIKAQVDEMADGRIDRINERRRDVVESEKFTKEEQKEVSDNYEETGTNSMQALVDGANTKINEEKPNIVNNLIDGLAAEVYKPENINKITNLGYNGIGGVLLDSIKSRLGINSPSKEMMFVAGYCVEGLLKGFKDNEANVEQAGIETGRSTLRGLSNALSAANDYLLDEDINPTITPVLDLSNIQNGASLINSLLNNGNNIGLGLNGQLGLAGAGNITLNATFNVDSKQEVTRADVAQWSSWLLDDINEGLGRNI